MTITEADEEIDLATGEIDMIERGSAHRTEGGGEVGSVTIETGETTPETERAAVARTLLILGIVAKGRIPLENLLTDPRT